MSRISKLAETCTVYGERIQGISHDGLLVPGRRLLLTLAGMESAFGVQREYVRPEPGYMPGGGYYKKSPELRQEYKRYGVLAGSSFGTWQIMYMTAKELGFNGHPILLQGDDACCDFASKLIANRLIGRHKAKTLRDILDGYNSGNHFDQIVPQSYIDKGFTFYRDLQGV
jgi:hypothetical protein